MKWFSLGMRTKPKPSSTSVPVSPSSPPTPPGAAAHRAPHPGDLRQVFEHFDADGDGRISASDLASLLRRVGVPDDAESMVRAADLDGDGYVSLEEFAAVCCGAHDGSPPLRGPEDRDLRAAFEVYDRDGDGVISAEELQEVLCGVMGEGAATLAECEGMVRVVDRNGDGAVSFDEFERMTTTRSLARN